MGTQYSTASGRRTMFLYGCLAALAMGVFSCCFLGTISLLPVFSRSVPPPPAADPARQDITIIVPEAFLVRALADALPESASGKATLDVRPGNQLVLQAKANLLLAEVEINATFGLVVQNGQLRLTIESLDAGGQDLTAVFGSSTEALMEQISRIIQQQVETGLGPGAQIMAVETDDQHMIIKARWER